LSALNDAGWETCIARGADSAIDWLVEKIEKATNEKKGEENE